MILQFRRVQNYAHVHLHQRQR